MPLSSIGPTRHTCSQNAPATDVLASADVSAGTVRCGDYTQVPFTPREFAYAPVTRRRTVIRRIAGDPLPARRARTHDPRVLARRRLAAGQGRHRHRPQPI